MVIVIQLEEEKLVYTTVFHCGRVEDEPASEERYNLLKEEGHVKRRRRRMQFLRFLIYLLFKEARMKGEESRSGRRGLLEFLSYICALFLIFLLYNILCLFVLVVDDALLNVAAQLSLNSTFTISWN